MKTCLAFIFAFCITYSLTAQDVVMGYWTGKMKSEYGNYEFSLSISPQRDGKMLDWCGSRSNIKAVAMHNRMGMEEVIELNGVYYSDNSIYFADERDPHGLKKDESFKFSRLQFLLKFEKGQPVLDGHWQEYKNMFQYRKGRLLLKKGKGKA